MSIMNHLLSKKRVNNQKGCLFNEKITKSYTTFCENKPNSPNVQMVVTIFIIMIYTIFTSLTKVKNKPNQSQYKPNSNPIQARPRCVLSCFSAGDLSSNVAVGGPIFKIRIFSDFNLNKRFEIRKHLFFAKFESG